MPMKKIPDAEFEVMKIIWNNEPPITTNQIIQQLDNDKSWKQQTVLTLLVRLVEKGFLSSEKKGKERSYSPIISKKEYLEFETGGFINKFYKNSLTSLLNTFYEGQKLSEKDVQELKKWFQDKR